YWDHWALLVEALRLICSYSNTMETLKKAGSLLDQFVEKCSDLYGEDSMIMCVHACLHLQQCMEQFGASCAISANIFEHCGSVFTNILKSMYCVSYFYFFLSCFSLGSYKRTATVFTYMRSLAAIEYYWSSALSSSSLLRQH